MLAGLRATSMPQTGSIATSTGATGSPLGLRAGFGHGGGPNGPRSIGLTRKQAPRGGVGGPQRDDLGEDRKRNLLGRHGPDLEASRGVKPVELLLGEVERLLDGVAALLAGDEADVWDLVTKSRSEDPLLVVPVRGDEDGRVVGARLGPLGRVLLDRVAEPRPRSARAWAIGVVPTTRRVAAGRRGFRKISRAPPLRQGFLTVTAPSSTAGSPSAPLGRIRRSTGSPD